MSSSKLIFGFITPGKVQKSKVDVFTLEQCRIYYDSYTFAGNVFPTLCTVLKVVFLHIFKFRKFPALLLKKSSI